MEMSVTSKGFLRKVVRKGMLHAEGNTTKGLLVKEAGISCWATNALGLPSSPEDVRK